MWWSIRFCSNTISATFYKIGKCSNLTDVLNMVVSFWTAINGNYFKPSPVFIPQPGPFFELKFCFISFATSFTINLANILRYNLLDFDLALLIAGEELRF